jgi:CRP-like cAMP-binding protein
MPIPVPALRRCASLDNLDDVSAGKLAAVLESTRYKSGSQVCREGDASDCAWLLVGGTVAVLKNLPDGRRVKLATLEGGTLFGQAGLIPGQLRTAEVKAESDVELAVLRRATLEWDSDVERPGRSRCSRSSRSISCGSCARRSAGCRSSPPPKIRRS